jgi:hypothetical protein
MMHSGEGILLELKLKNASSLFAEFAAISFVGSIAAAAGWTGIGIVLFPELAALSFEVFRHPTGKWAVQPLRLVATPTLTATIGLFAARHAHFGVLSILAVTLASLGTIRLLRSSIGPAISAGLLPLVLNEQRWLYPLAIFADLLCLAALLWLWKRYGPVRPEGTSHTVSVSDKLEAAPTNRLWLLHLISFVALLAVVGQRTGLWLILFPPLVVMAFEILGHPEGPAWAERPFLFPLACALPATASIFALHVVRNQTLCVMAVLTVSILSLRVFKIHMPPALAVGLIPFIMTAPNYSYPASVVIGASTLAAWSLIRTRLRQIHLSRSSQRAREQKLSDWCPDDRPQLTATQAGSSSD